MTSQDVLLYETDGPVAILTLNRPDNLNALNAELLDALEDTLTRIESDPAVSVVILKGAGRGFCAGMDLKGYSPAELGISANRAKHEKTLNHFLRIWEFPKPVIGQVHGLCCAGGTMLALACDITLVSDDCRIRFPSITIGGGFTSSFWTYFVGPKKAKEMDFIAGSEMTGAEAVQWGWGNHAIPDAELPARALRMARQIAKTPSDLLRLKKLAINRVGPWRDFRQSIMAGAEWDTLCNFTDGAQALRKRITDMGLKEAIRSLQVDDDLR